MSDYEVPVKKERRRKRKEFIIPGQSSQLCRDVHEAYESGMSYGKYMGIKASESDDECYEKFGIRLRRGDSKLK